MAIDGPNGGEVTGSNYEGSAGKDRLRMLGFLEQGFGIWQVTLGDGERVFVPRVARARNRMELRCFGG